MIKALIIVHIWSLIIAAIAWVLQRDKKEIIGINFPSPQIWIGLIALCFLPSALSFISINRAVVPDIKVIEIISSPITATATETVSPINYLMIYFALSIILMNHTLWQWTRLQRLSLIPTSNHDIFVTDADVPPLTLSWPRRAIVLPNNDQNHQALIRHERAHMHHKDAEVTILLLLMRDLMLRGLGVSYLVRQWRLAIELRADKAATKMLTTSERRDYASLLLNDLKPSGHHAHRRTLPCPTAHLTSTRHRSVKMRLTEIMENKSNPRKPRWSAAIMLVALGASTVGLISTNALAENNPIIGLADEVHERVVTNIPTNCQNFDLNTLVIEGSTINLNGIPTMQHTITFGSVTMKYDIQSDGTPFNSRILHSTNPCFEPNAKAFLEQIKNPKTSEVKDVIVIMKFMITGETHEDLNGPLNDFARSTH